MDSALITQLKILKLSESKPNFSELARKYDVDRRTIKKYYDGYEGKPVHHNKPSKLDKHKALIEQKLSIKGVNIKAVYKYLINEVDPDMGSYSNFIKYLKKNQIKPNKTQKGHARFETAPGYQAQVDWKEDMSLANRYGEIFTLQIFSYKLGHSRYCHFVYKNTKTQQDVFDCLIDSFIATGGVPREILFDNMTTIVNLKGNHRVINNKVKAFADDFGFNIRLAKPRAPYTKGKVEAANKFLTRLLPYEGEFETEADLIRILANINKDVNTDICQETNIPPLLLFQKEKEHLLPLPKNKVMESYLNYNHKIQVQQDSLIYYKKHKYSVPPEYINKNVYIKSTDEKLDIYYETELIATHNISEKRINYDKKHYEALLSQNISNKDTVCKVAEKNLQLMDMFL